MQGIYLSDMENVQKLRSEKIAIPVKSEMLFVISYGNFFQWLTYKTKHTHSTHTAVDKGFIHKCFVAYQDIDVEV